MILARFRKIDAKGFRAVGAERFRAIRVRSTRGRTNRSPAADCSVWLQRPSRLRACVPAMRVP